MKRLLSFFMAAVLLAVMLPFKSAAAKGDKLIALTFDDGPHSTYTQRLLDGLKARDVKVTFFMLGANASYYPDIVKRVYEEGHEIACHSWNHPALTTLSDSAVRDQMQRSYTQFDKACGTGTEYMVRPPYGDINQRVLNAIAAPVIYWSLDSIDWQLRNVEKVRDRIVAQAFDGAIVLCHDIHYETISASLQAIDRLKAQGYEFVTVSELYRRRGAELRRGEIYYSCKPNGTDLGEIPAPTISCDVNEDGIYTVTIKGNSSAPIYYTTDGSYPNQNSKRYTGPFTVSYQTEINAVAAYKLNGSRSDTVKLTKEQYGCAVPKMSLDSEGKLLLSCATKGARIYYTLDNTPASVSSEPYSGPVEISKGSYIRAVAVNGHNKISAEIKGFFSQDGILYGDMSPDKWYYKYMEQMNLEGILYGTAAHTMSPNGKLDRAMMVTLLYRYSGEVLGEGWEATHTFSDINSNSYYAEAVEWAYRNGIVNGYGETEFAPKKTASRQELCKVIACYLEYKGRTLPTGESHEDDFGDYDKISGWALPYVEAMINAGLINGINGNVEPASTATRAQFSAIMCRMNEL